MFNDQVYTENSIRTFTGKVFDLAIMDPDSICIEDIAHGLAHTARFGGQLMEFVSVAQHCFTVYNMCSQENKLAGLLHDAAEAYLGDMPSPFKKMMPEYKAIEHRLMTVIAEKFGFQYPFEKQIKVLDQQVLELEWESFVLFNPDFTSYRSWAPEYAEKQFLMAFNSLK